MPGCRRYKKKTSSRGGRRSKKNTSSLGKRRKCVHCKRHFTLKSLLDHARDCAEKHRSIFGQLEIQVVNPPFTINNEDDFIASAVENVNSELNVKIKSQSPLVIDTKNDMEHNIYTDNRYGHDMDLEFSTRQTDPYKKNEEYRKAYNISDTGFGRRAIQDNREGRAQVRRSRIEREDEVILRNVDWNNTVLINLVRDCHLCQEELTHWKVECVEPGKKRLLAMCKNCGILQYGEVHIQEATCGGKFDHPLHPFIGFRDEDVPTKYPSTMCWVKCHCCGLVVLFKHYEDHLKHACCGEFQPSKCELCPAEFDLLEGLYSHSLKKHNNIITFREIKSMLRFENAGPCRSAIPL